MFKQYPNSSEIELSMRPVLHPMFQKLADGISEYTFANIYLFRKVHNYRISRLEGELYVITGDDNGERFFMLPFGLPGREMLETLFAKHDSLKACSVSQSMAISLLGYAAFEDRANFDYLYSRNELAELSGKDMGKKRNRLNAFLREFECEAKPLLDEYAKDALECLDAWRAGRGDPGDYEPCKEALEKMNELQLCGGIYYVDGRPVGFSLGEELAIGTSFVIHFEKAIDVEKYKGLYQYINQSFAAILPEKYETINREQDLDEPGLRRAKESYNPIGFVKKYRAQKSV